ncbi:MAG: hypothetical protein AAFX79_02495 [Planctomycetota bacterium]
MRDGARRPASCEMAEARSLEPRTRLTREQVVDRIISINRSASPAFLERFEDVQLTRYLARLNLAGGRPDVPWVRAADTPAIVGRDAAR